MIINKYFRVFCVLSLLLKVGVSVWGQSSNRNYVMSRTYKQATSNVSDDVSIVNMNVDYFDGLGRPIQGVQVQAAPKTDANRPQDIFQNTEYDNFGRVLKQYLPYPSRQNGAYWTVSASDIETYYNNAANFEKDDPGNNSLRVSQEIEYEKSPLGRVLKQYTPGPAVPGKDYVRFEYGLNIDSEVKRYDVSGSSLTQIIENGNYPPNTLTVVRSFDQNGNRTDEFTNKTGQVVLKRSYNSLDIQKLDTYYVYDNFGQLRAVLQPEFQNSAQLNLYAFLYEYNDRGLLTKKQTPGGGQTTLTYDSRDRLSTITDAKAVTITNSYDDLNRVVSTSQGGSNITTTQYDTYDTWTGLGFKADEIPSLDSYVGTNATSNRKGVVTSTEAQVLGTSTMLRTVYYYDKKYRLIQTVRQLYNLKTSSFATEWHSILRDFAGKVLQERTTQSTDYGIWAVDKNYVYDQAERLLQTSHYIADVTNPNSVQVKSNIILNALRYNDIGQLKKKYLHSEDGGNRFTERLDTKNNLRGWLRTLNGYKSDGQDGQNFGMDLRYGKPQNGGTAQWNGNISELKWRQSGGTVQGYKFTYDGVNRLRAADGLDGFNNEEKNITYDLNGNLKTLQRTSGGANIDNLTYTYSGNRLSTVLDDSNNGNGQPGGIIGYSYDNNGNITGYDNKTFNYNILNLPSTITTPANQSNPYKYTYTADGTKLEYYDGSATTRYVSEMEYNQANALTRIATPDGQVAVSGNTFTYQYYLTDHLGNVRTIIDRTATVLQETDYYPFGLSIDRSGSTANKYRFNGKELQTITGWLDFGARMYLPQIGRWNRPDRFADKYANLSLYSAFDGNPLKYTDVNGDSLVINYFDANSQAQRVHYGYTQQGGYGFYNADGTAYTGNDKFISQVGSALARLGLGKEGRQMVDFLSNDAQTVTIGLGKNTYDDATHTVGFNPNSNTDIPTEGGTNGMAKAPTFISLGHELAHSEDHLKGTLNRNTTWNGYEEAEKYSTHRENQFRGENGLPLRTHYGVDISTGVKRPDPNSAIIDSKGYSLFFKSIKYRK